MDKNASTQRVDRLVENYRKLNRENKGETAPFKTPRSSTVMQSDSQQSETDEVEIDPMSSQEENVAEEKPHIVRAKRTVIGLETYTSQDKSQADSSSIQFDSEKSQENSMFPIFQPDEDPEVNDVQENAVSSDNPVFQKEIQANDLEDEDLKDPEDIEECDLELNEAEEGDRDENEDQGEYANDRDGEEEVEEQELPEPKQDEKIVEDPDQKQDENVVDDPEPKQDENVVENPDPKQDEKVVEHSEPKVTEEKKKPKEKKPKEKKLKEKEPKEKKPKEKKPKEKKPKEKKPKEQSKGTRKPKARKVEAGKTIRKKRSDSVYNEIVKAQKNDGLVIPKLPFKRVIKDMFVKSSTANGELRIQAHALVALQFATEQLMHEIFRKCTSLLEYKSRQGLDNFTFSMALKLMPPPLDVMFSEAAAKAREAYEANLAKLRASKLVGSKKRKSTEPKKRTLNEENDEFRVIVKPKKTKNQPA